MNPIDIRTLARNKLRGGLSDSLPGERKAFKKGKQKGLKVPSRRGYRPAWAEMISGGNPGQSYDETPPYIGNTPEVTP